MKKQIDEGIAPISHEGFLCLVERISKGSTKFLDGPVLSALLMLCYVCGFKRSELVNLRISDILDRKHKVRNSINIKDSIIPVSTEARKCIESHLAYLKSKGYSRRRSSPLFPMKNGNNYNPKTITNHLAYFISQSLNITLDKIRQSGIYHYYDSMKSNGKPDEQSRKATVIMSRRSKRHTDNLLSGRIQRTGQKIDPIAKYLLMMEGIDRHGINEVSKRRAIIDQALQDIKEDQKVSKTQKAELIKEFEKLKSLQSDNKGSEITENRKPGEPDGEPKPVVDLATMIKNWKI